MRGEGGRGRQSPGSGRRGTERGGGGMSGSTRRNGYAYKYDGDDNKYIDDDAVVEVEARAVRPTGRIGGARGGGGRRSERSSWSERLADADRVPPAGVKVWGPNGDDDVPEGTDARGYAAGLAREEIEEARGVTEIRAEEVADAEGRVVGLKA